MRAAQNNRNDNFNPKGGNGKSSFEEHNERMRAFRLTHPNNWSQWGHRVSKVQEGLPALVATVPLRRVVLASRYWQN